MLTPSGYSRPSLSQILDVKAKADPCHEAQVDETDCKYVSKSGHDTQRSNSPTIAGDRLRIDSLTHLTHGDSRLSISRHSLMPSLDKVPHLSNARGQLARSDKAALIPVWRIICSKGREVPAIPVLVLHQLLHASLAVMLSRHI